MFMKKLNLSQEMCYRMLGNGGPYLVFCRYTHYKVLVFSFLSESFKDKQEVYIKKKKNFLNLHYMEYIKPLFLVQLYGFFGLAL